MQALRLRVGADSYAVPMEDAREVITAPSLTALPTAPPSVLGVCNLRGEIIPVFDTGILLGLAPVDAWAWVAIVETALGPAGLAATDPGESIELGEPVGTTDGPATAGAYATPDGLAVLLDVEALLTPARVGS